ncbi:MULTISPECIES: FAD-dependent monooxygenase [Acetobacter]|jgi:2-polyprenyl-6-methoxyphenol hydroxylase-like FAD-dependent oxidoreductase|uniref:2-polyprenyl-6-methoxyphenol hydroxylase-like FAD-dependent oxidoreductase n=1 Tax=Acetobacter lovaniensis TaxID=104100 RepID=A0A841QJG7_9PROT|nr:FAD-dependent monooxygenase [Acetobacter lovaniensis]MBB6458364.1 2-polyprenyl-6-methoxyphenol hydroxylase-like FAD-dependent oxidoreductase [Acetobacter lovaniensis]MCI1796090.1 FAD-dependent monooxygenase [Acetobacter lovaniensis]MCP1240735.1 FAD-dependent monooxygenase [Acetobacter lovaniensis]NHN82571.1 FAD-dependent oxidoreductase [Acetobacter lovaniensis]GBQ72704.1 2-polyprenyl-6-methoxyphenol hydroxylase [Acetobacter lovaniensis NRIC 0474]
MSKRKFPTQNRRVLISGASIAGPALAFWLAHYGFDVTVVEHASTIRTGGYPIDIRGAAIDVVERMGLLPQVRAAHINTRLMTFVDGDGNEIGAVPVYDAVGSNERDVELPRGTLATLLYDASRTETVRYRFNDSIETLHDDGLGVHIRFTSGISERYDIVVGADGLHSRTRRLVFGAEDQFRRDLGCDFAIFSLQNDRGLSHGGIFHAEPGRVAGLFAVQNSQRMFGFLTFVTDQGAPRDVRAQLNLIRTAYADMRWEVPRLLVAMAAADDLYFDSVSQIRMPHWSKGSVVLLGDAAFAPSFRSGQGTSLALVGAYVLAGELASHENTAAGLEAYERNLRPFVEANQALATDGRGAFFLPRTQADIDMRDHLLAEIARNGPEMLFDDTRSAAHCAISLPDYPIG